MRHPSSSGCQRQLTPADLRELETEFSKIEVQGGRMNENADASRRSTPEIARVLSIVAAERADERTYIYIRKNQGGFTSAILRLRRQGRSLRASDVRRFRAQSKR